MTKQIRLSHLTFALLLEELLSGPSTVSALAEHSGMSHRYLCKVMKAMHGKKVVHISGWEKDSIGRQAQVRVYGLGPGRDKPRPIKTRQEVNEAYRRRAAKAEFVGTPFAGLGA